MQLRVSPPNPRPREMGQGFVFLILHRPLLVDLIDRIIIRL